MILIPTFVFLFGIVIGSFLNVCIHRLPRGESVVRPRSRCPHCGQPVAAYDNIPLLSWLLLGGKCRHCRAPISPVYFFVELATGLLFLHAYGLFGPTPDFLKQITFGSLLIVLVMTDWQERILPDLINFPGMALGLMFAVVVPIGDGSGLWLARAAGLERLPLAAVSVLDSLLGALAGGGLLYVLGELYFRLRGRQGMGFGDVKMMAMVGCFLGPKLTFLTILLGSAGGSIIGLLLIAALRKGPDYELPFGTFLGVAAWAASLWGWPILRWYAGLFPAG
ncbi:MAG TPA: prepilin peptidase [Terriglobia bacterium]|nr:prepilin peptidase [Terriglobia bacterium]